MAKSTYKNLRGVIAGMLCDDDFAIVDAAMSQMGDCKLAEGTEDPVYGKHNAEFQENVEFGTNEVTAKLYHISGWTAFSSKEEEQHGYYIHVKADTTLDDDLYDLIINNVLVNPLDDETKQPLNPDRNIVIWIKESFVKATGKKRPKINLKVRDKKTGEIVKDEMFIINATYVPENEPETIDENANA